MRMIVSVCAIVLIVTLQSCCSSRPEMRSIVDPEMLSTCCLISEHFLANSDGSFFRIRPRDPNEILVIRITKLDYSPQNKRIHIVGIVSEFASSKPVGQARIQMGILKSKSKTNYDSFQFATQLTWQSDKDGSFSISDSLQEGLALVLDFPQFPQKLVSIYDLENLPYP